MREYIYLLYTIVARGLKIYHFLAFFLCFKVIVDKCVYMYK